MWGDDFVRTERLSWVYERGQNLILRSQPDRQRVPVNFSLTLPAFLHSLPTEVGKGLLIPKGILTPTQKKRQCVHEFIRASKVSTLHERRKAEYESYKWTSHISMESGAHRCREDVASVAGVRRNPFGGFASMEGAVSFTYFIWRMPCSHSKFI